MEVVYGCMFSGKTSRYIETVQRLRGQGVRVICIKHAWDTRYTEDGICSHDGQVLVGVDHRVDRLMPLVAGWAAAPPTNCWIAVEEAQFFPDLLEFCTNVRTWSEVRLLVCGLDLTSKGEWFGDMQSVVAMADQRTYLQARCVTPGCTRPAQISHRLVADQAEILVGGSESYVPMCLGCHRIADPAGAMPVVVSSDKPLLVRS